MISNLKEEEKIKDGNINEEVPVTELHNGRLVLLCEML